jgi:hypothetical protein
MIGLILQNVKDNSSSRQHPAPEQALDAKPVGGGPFRPEWNDTIGDVPESERLMP